MQIIIRYRIPALVCALAVLLCAFLAHPVANMGICDDGPYILIARHLATTGRIHYNGNTTPFLGWQLYLGALLIKLFGFSYTAVRMSTVIVAMGSAFVLQRTLVLVGISERNATIGTLALVLSPLYLILSVTYMTDITGMFGILICLYGCLRAIRPGTSRAAIGWLCFAVATNAICGSSRQIAWLGVLVMVPSTLWLLRGQRYILLAGATANLAGAMFIVGCMHWFLHQPYNAHESLMPNTFPVFATLKVLGSFFLEIPFLLLPLTLLFLPEIRRSRPRVIGALFLGFLLMTVHPRHVSHVFLMEPTADGDFWVNAHGIFDYLWLQGTPPIFVHRGVQALLTIATYAGLIGLIGSMVRSPDHRLPANSSGHVSWKQLGVLLVPFLIAYSLLLVPRAATSPIADRYLIGILVVPLLVLVRYYQERIRRRLPIASVFLIGLVAIYSIVMMHNTFAFYRARTALAAQLRDSGVPDTSVDNGWEYDFVVELDHANHLNDSRIVWPVHAYIPRPLRTARNCSPGWVYDLTPHIHPLYGVSFDPTACYGPAPFAPVHYSRWPYRTPGTLYVVRYEPPVQQ
jgi:hypothetical protein